MALEAFGSLRWYLEMDGITDGMFKEVSGLDSETEVIEHRHTTKRGGNQVVHKVPGALKWPNIVFKRGLTDDTKLHDWRKSIEEGKIATSRKNGTITCYGPGVQSQENSDIVAQYQFTNGWPCKLKGPALDATKNELAIEEMEICHEGLKRIK